MQAIWLGDVYLSLNANVTPTMVTVVYTIALEISIKMNEDVILGFHDLVQLFENNVKL